MCHFLRRKPDGNGYELRSRFWFGYAVKDSFRQIYATSARFSLIVPG